MARLLLGNSAALDGGLPLDGDRITTAELPDHLPADAALRTLFDPNGLWPAHSANLSPDWVECDDAALADAVAARAGCPVGRPDDWEG